MLCYVTRLLFVAFGPWGKARWQNLIVGAVVAGFLVISGLLVVATLFPHLATGWPAKPAAAQGPKPRRLSCTLDINPPMLTLRPDNVSVPGCRRGRPGFASGASPASAASPATPSTA